MVNIKLLPGDIVFFDASNYKEKIIKKFANSNFSFVGIVVYVMDSKVFIAQSGANHGLVIKKYMLDEIKKLHIKRPIEKIEHLQNFVFTFRGIPFKIKDLIHVFLYKYFNISKYYDIYNTFTTAWTVAITYFYTSHGKIDFSKEFKKPVEKITANDIYRSKFFKDLLSLRSNKIILRRK